MNFGWIKCMYLDEVTFLTVVAKTSLVSTDLIIKNDLNPVLLGQILKQPARCFASFLGGGF